MKKVSKDFLGGVHKPIPKQVAWEWNRDNVDFSRVPNYETPLQTKYDPEFMPFWKEPCSDLTDPEVSEVWVIKPSRAGATENIILNRTRHIVAVDPQSTLCLSGDQDSTEHLMEKRIKLGLKCAELTAKKLAEAQASEHKIYFRDMDLITHWPKSKMAFKQSGYQTVLGDEISTWPSYATDMLRGRVDTYAFSHVCGISSLDPQQKRPTKEDPIFIEFNAGDQRYWMLPDPKKRGKKFRFEMGSEDLPYGLKWDPKAKRPNGTWDIDRVKATAHYLTPYGTKITNKDRQALVAKGQWVPTNPDAPKGIHSYHLNAFYLPFKKGDFGNIAAAFLTAKQKGRVNLRVFIYEYLGEEWTEDTNRAESDLLYDRCRKYAKGAYISDCKQKVNDTQSFKDIYLAKTKKRFISVDVQQAHLWLLCREWIEGGDSGLIDYKYAITWEQVEEMADKYEVERVGVDYGYPERRIEVFEYAWQFKALPLMGRPHMEMGAYPLKKNKINIREGRKTGNRKGDEKYKIGTYTFSADIFGVHMLDCMRGESDKSWFLYDRIDERYCQQAASMERVDGVWSKKRGHSQNHMWDCEVMQLVLATIYRLIRFEWSTNR